MKTKNYNFTILGAPQVGKSNIASRFYQDTFTQNYDETIQGTFTRPFVLDGQSYSITVTDTAGQQKFQSLSHIWTDRKDGFIFVFDITKIETYEIAIKRLKDIKKMASLKKVPCVLVGNKIDLERDRRVCDHKALKKAEEFGAKYIEASAKDRVNIKEIFDLLIKQNQLLMLVEDKTVDKSHGWVDTICEQKCSLI